jgi:hypothetical protein
MPIYKYNCDCGESIEVTHGMEEKRVYKCDCGATMYKDYSCNGFMLKGGCWASDGYQPPVKIERDKNYRNYYREAKNAGKLPSHVLREEKQKDSNREII